MNKRGIDFIYWAIFFLLVLVPVSLVVNNSLELFPTSEHTIYGVALFEIGTCLILHLLVRRTADAELEQLCRVGTIIIGIVAICNLLVHFNLKRETDAAELSRVERKADEKDSVENQVKLLSAQKDLVNADTRRLMQLPQGAGRRARTLPTIGLPTPTATPTAQMRTPDEVRAAHMPRILWAAAFSLLACLAFISVVAWKYNEDTDGNGQADWQDRQEARQANAPKDKPRPFVN